MQNIKYTNETTEENETNNSITKIFNNIPIFWINLNDSYQRKNKLIEQLGSYKYNYRIEAIDGRNSELFYKNYDIIVNNSQNYTTALMAVICSHFKAIKKGYNLGYDMMCVFEDDVNFELLEYYPYTIKDIIDKTPDDWEVIQLYHNEDLDIMTHLYGKQYLSVISRYKDFTGTCYIINRNGMEKILNNKINTDGDDQFHFINSIESPESSIFSGLNAYVLEIPFLHFGDFETTFNKYTDNDNDCKFISQDIHNFNKNLLRNFYKMK